MSQADPPDYQVNLPVFEGPLDLLLHLIERQELDITQVSLAQVTNQYLDHLARIEERDPDRLADFLVVAAKLLLIKSRALLPQPTGRLEPDEEDIGEAEELVIALGVGAVGRLRGLAPGRKARAGKVTQERIPTIHTAEDRQSLLRSCHSDIEHSALFLQAMAIAPGPIATQEDVPILQAFGSVNGG